MLVRNMFDESMEYDRQRRLYMKKHKNDRDYHDYDSFQMFQTELKQVFTFLKNVQNKKKLRKMIEENKEEWYNIENETYELIAELTNSHKLMECLQNEKEAGRGGVNMANAIDEIYNDGVEWGLDKGIRQGRDEGRGEGRSEGKMITLIMQSRKKQAKGKTAEEAADALEEDVHVIAQIYHLLNKYPEKNEEELYIEYQKSK